MSHAKLNSCHGKVEIAFHSTTGLQQRKLDAEECGVAEGGGCT
jgi:hypothetical protein